MGKNYWRLEEGSKEERVYRNLEKQIISTFKHCRQGGIKTRKRYVDSMRQFSKYLAVSHNKQSLNNIDNRHIAGYIEQMQDAYYATSTVTTNMAAIRFFVDQKKDASYIKSNKELGVIPRSKEERIGDSKAWTIEQVDKMEEIARIRGFDRVSDMIRLAYQTGLRIHEVTRLERANLQKALREGIFQVKGKGGLIRDIAIRNEQSREHIKKLLKQSNVRDYKVFVSSNEKTHEVIKQAQNFIANHRGNGETITFHGLRHTYSQERYADLRNEGKSDYDSRLIVSRELGHFRVEITDIYLK